MFLILLLLYLLVSRFHLLEMVAAKTVFLQNSCSEYFISQLSHGELASAFVCGTAIRDPYAHEIFIQTGLIHLMVVSGSHLQMLSALISWLRPASWKSIWIDLTMALLLVFYALLSGFQPPVIRALVARMLAIVSDYFRWNWDSGKITMASGLLLLAISPFWIFNFSFFLSWLACLGLIAGPLCLPKPWRSQRSARALIAAGLRFCFSCFCVQALMAVALKKFSLLSLMMNCLVAPVISVLLFPLSLSIIVIPSFQGFIDVVWENLLQFLLFFSEMGSPLAISPFPSAESWAFLWIFLAFIHAFFEFLQCYRYRGSSV